MTVGELRHMLTMLPGDAPVWVWSETKGEYVLASVSSGTTEDERCPVNQVTEYGQERVVLCFDQAKKNQRGATLMTCEILEKLPAGVRGMIENGVADRQAKAEQREREALLLAETDWDASAAQMFELLLKADPSGEIKGRAVLMRSVMPDGWSGQDRTHEAEVLLPGLPTLCAAFRRTFTNGANCGPYIIPEPWKLEGWLIGGSENMGESVNRPFVSSLQEALLVAYDMAVSPEIPF